MQNWKRLTAVGLVIAASVAVSIAPASAGSTTTRWVDDDGRAGPGGCGGSARAFQHVQAAVNASNADDIVIVCAGTYVEQVRIRGSRDGLTLKSSSPFSATIKAPTSLAEPLGFAHLVLVDHVRDVTVRGFKIVTRTEAPCDRVDASLIAIGSNRTAFRGNRLMAPGSGANADCSQEVGIAILDTLSPSSSPTTSAVIGFNEVRDAPFAAIAAVGENSMVKVNIVHNSVRAYFGASPSGNSILDDYFGGSFGIALLGRVRGVVRDNVVQGASAAPLDGPTWYTGIGVAPSFMTGAANLDNGPIDIHDNIVRRVIYGFLLSGTDQLTVRRNQVGNAAFGIYMAHSEGNSIQGNTIGAKVTGLAVDNTSAGNQLRRNTVSGAGGSCEDASSGSGTAGTANTWSGNTASEGSTPSGLCAAP